MESIDILTTVAIAASTLVLAAEYPVQGTIDPTLERLDRVVMDVMSAVGATAASICVQQAGLQENDGILVQRSYGWFDAGKRKTLTPRDTFRLGSNTKPFTAATIYRLIESTDLTLETPVLSALKLRRANGQVRDERFREITIEQLLAHRGGFDREESFDPMYRLQEIRKAVRPGQVLRSEDVIAYMLDRPLDFDPGARRAYSNFGFVLLGRVIVAQTGLTYEKAVQQLIAQPLEIKDLRVSNANARRRPPREVDYPDDSTRMMRVRSSAGGLTGSPLALCKLMSAYWIIGPKRDPDDVSSYYHYGSLPSTTLCLMVQRPDGINWALAFNRRRDDTFLEDLSAIHQRVREVLDERVKPLAD